MQNAKCRMQNAAAAICFLPTASLLLVTFYDVIR
jgi:hypothetical protein